MGWKAKEPPSSPSPFPVNFFLPPAEAAEKTFTFSPSPLPLFSRKKKESGGGRKKICGPLQNSLKKNGGGGGGAVKTSLVIAPAAAVRGEREFLFENPPVSESGAIEEGEYVRGKKGEEVRLKYWSKFSPSFSSPAAPLWRGPYSLHRQPRIKDGAILGCGREGEKSKFLHCLRPEILSFTSVPRRHFSSQSFRA